MLGVHGQEIRKPRGRSALQKDTPNSCAFSFQIVKTEAFPAGIVSVFKRFFFGKRMPSTRLAEKKYVFSAG